MSDYPSYFKSPTMVRFWQNPEDTGEETPNGVGGIAFGDIIICGECGQTIGIEDTIKLEALPWISISQEILGD